MIRLLRLPDRAQQARLLAWLAALALALQGVAGAYAQATGPSVAITAVDSEAFPSVTAQLTVTGANGLPLVGLSADNFTVLEDGQAVPASDVALESDTSRPLTLVLAVDLAMPGEELLAVQAALREFTDALTAQDQVALLAFADEVVVAQAFTNDKLALATAIGGLTPSGDATVFNQAADTAVNLLAALPEGRKAALLFTDSGDTANTLSPESTINNAQASGVALYPFGYGDKVNETIINNWARFTGGQAYLLATPGEILGNLETLGVLLRQSYRITYTSGVTADNARHDLSIELDYQDQTVAAESRFTAVPGEVTIEGLTIANGQTLRGMVFLIADVTAPAPVESVTFKLDGETLVELTSPPYRFDWDTATAGAGTHAVTVTARDRAGNTGEQQVSVNVAVPPPVVATAAPLPPPVPTESRVVVFARNTLNVARIVLWGLLPLGAFLVALALWLRARSGQKPAVITHYKVELVNRGNARTQFELRAEDPARLMKFQFLINDAGLAMRQAPATVAYAPAQATPGASLAPAAAASTNGKTDSKGRKVRVPKPKNALQKAQGMAFGAANISTRISGWVVAVTYFLPAQLRSKVRVQTAQARDVGFQAHEAAEAPDRYKRMADHVVDIDGIKEKVGGAKAQAGKGQAALPPAQAAGATMVAGPTAPTLAMAPAGTAVGTATMMAPPAQPTLVTMAAASTAGWALTPYVEPGGSLTIKLHIAPVRVPKTQSYAFRILSRSADSGDPHKLTQIENGSVALATIPWSRQVLPWLLLVVMLGALALMVWYVLVTFGVIGGG